MEGPLSREYKSLRNLPPRERELSKKTAITTSLKYQSVYNQFEMKEDSIKTVSYTHLDVYKRQPRYCKTHRKVPQNDVTLQNGAYNSGV